MMTCSRGYVKRLTSDLSQDPREVEVEPRVAQQPGLHGLGLVRAGVGQDDVHFEVVRHGFVDLGEECLELLGPVAPASGGDHPACSDIEGCEQIGDPVAQLVMRPSLHLAGSHRQDRLSPVECLDARTSARAGRGWGRNLQGGDRVRCDATRVENPFRTVGSEPSAEHAIHVLEAACCAARSGRTVADRSRAFSQQS